MIMKFFSQIVLSTVLLQLFPVDAADVQRLVESKSVSPSAYTALTLPFAHLPTAEAAEPGPRKINPSSLGVETSAASALVMDRKTKRLLFQKNMDTPRSIGSITKLMTAYVFLQTKPDLQAPASLASEDFRAGGVQHLPFGEEVTLKDLLVASLMSSDNSATAAIMRLSGMNEGDFVAKMNETAAEIGMEHTIFADPTGLSPKNESVVEDIARLLDRVGDVPEIREVTSHPSLDLVSRAGNTFHLKSTDELLNSFVTKDPYGLVVAKTGYLPEAGYCLGSLFSKQNSGDILVVVLGAASNADRFQDMKSLVVWTYNTFDWAP